MLPGEAAFPDKAHGFMEFDRVTPERQSVPDRLKHWGQFETGLPGEILRRQGYRCMNCGVPFCHQGCPLGNVIPDFNDMVKDDNWFEALEILHGTNNFPEFTGCVCPAPCETSCVLGINEPPVTIKNIERAIAERGWLDEAIVPRPAPRQTGKRVAVVGSGPSGLAAAQQLARAGHRVTLYERDDEPGGLLMYGIPDFKMDKDSVRRRVRQMKAEGVEFRLSCEIGKDVPASRIVDENDALLLAIGSTQSRDLAIPGRDLDGIHFAMEFLVQQNRRVAGKEMRGPEILATGKKIDVLGGGDTGSDCHGTSLRQGAASVDSLELLPKPPEGRNEATPWPDWPLILRTSSSHEEGGRRDWSVLTKGFIGKNGQLTGIQAVRLKWGLAGPDGLPEMSEIEGSEFVLEADLCLLALGFMRPEHTVATELGLDLDPRGNLKAAYGDASNPYKTSHDKVWAAGDSRRGQSLVVWAIHEGREAAHAIDAELMGRTDLPSINSHGYGQVTI